MADYKQLEISITAWIRNIVIEAGARGCTVGVSGGIDSAVTLALCKKSFPDDMLGLIMPCGNGSDDEKFAIKLCNKFKVPYKILSMETMFDSFTDLVGDDGAESNLANVSETRRRLALANSKARFRMTLLYYYAQINNYLVVGTGNKTEEEIGYFTKYGDGGADLLPVTDLFKHEIREFGKYLGVISEITERIPSGGLWKGQTDEGEIGLTYDAMEYALRHILNMEMPERLQSAGGEDVVKKVQQMRKVSEHKRKMPPAYRMER